MQYDLDFLVLPSDLYIMKTYLPLIFLCAFCFSAFAQGDTSTTRITRDRIYLKDGFVILGVITDRDSSGTVKIQSGNKEFIYHSAEIKKIEKEKPVKLSKPQIYGFKKKGYIGTLEAGFTYITPSDQNYAIPMASLHFINSMQESPLFSMGAGVGVEFSGKDFYTVPLFADFRLNFTRKKSSPFAEIAIGYAGIIAKMPVVDGLAFKYLSSFLFSPSLGWRFHINSKFAATIAASYKLYGVDINYYTYQNNLSWGPYQYTIIYQMYGHVLLQAASLRVGFQF